MMSEGGDVLVENMVTMTGAFNFFLDAHSAMSHALSDLLANGFSRMVHNEPNNAVELST